VRPNGLTLMSAPQLRLEEAQIHVIQVLECSTEREKHADNMADAYESENSECEETSTDGRGEGRFYLDHMMDVYENDSETSECEENGGGEGRGCLPSPSGVYTVYGQSDCKFGDDRGDDLGRTNHLKTIR